LFDLRQGSQDATELASVNDGSATSEPGVAVGEVLVIEIKVEEDIGGADAMVAAAVRWSSQSDLLAG
jgi:hypothetical protein